MVRAAAPPAILYSVDTIGLSDTALKKSRVSVASAAAANAGGKNVDLTFYVLDGPAGTLDPAFDVHVNPAKFWALAIWEGWFGIDEMEQALAEAKARQQMVAFGRSSMAPSRRW